MMKLLVTLAICAVCVSGESLVRHKRGWGYETTPGWTTTQGWTTPPPPPPPTQGWGWKPTQGWTTPPPPTQGWGQPAPTQGWGWQPPPTSGWGSSSNNDYYGYSGRYQPPRRISWGGSRYGRDSPYRYRDYRDTFSSVRSSDSRRSSSLM